ncbi:hypothetical protein LTR78_000976 [Recurvomyces mirabilis]|uniref:Heterokaryon incompatibility domain-containing protein n=1 Tax=Recurvomyces mirabilis TaxID=574656 RepID=A0AAE0WW60_9PEZI|nr:hypothetical protein LTR78_000976 [Recurvomyces mirabilis]KAK5158948.1 hypothetical protein LTS14_003056 [Recurvomyces mirabilis]
MDHAELKGLASISYPKDVYTALDSETQEFRLLVLEQAQEKDDPVHCSVRKVSLLSTPPPLYETVSYVWGDTELKSEIFIHGRTTLVGYSAVQVLRRFRERGRDRVLWIDAVCINQHNDEERSRQVAMMADIYSGCTGVLIWLGEDNGFAERASLVIDAVVENAKLHIDDLHQLANVWEPGLPVSAGAIDKTIDLEPFYQLCSSPWFTRLWEYLRRADKPLCQ